MEVSSGTLRSGENIGRAGAQQGGECTKLKAGAKLENFPPTHTLSADGYKAYYPSIEAYVENKQHQAARVMTRPSVTIRGGGGEPIA